MNRGDRCAGPAPFGLFYAAVILCVALGLGPARASAPAAGAEPGARIVGTWLTEPKDGIIQISLAGNGLYEGRIVGGNRPGRLDEKNPDAALRQRLLRGQAILHGMHFDGDGRFSGGTIYDPDSGRTYKCRLELMGDGRLKVRGYIGISLLGKSQLWTRYAGTSMDLPASP